MEINIRLLWKWSQYKTIMKMKSYLTRDAKVWTDCTGKAG